MRARLCGRGTNKTRQGNIGSFAFVFVLLPSLLPAAGASSPLHGSAWPFSLLRLPPPSALANLVLVLPASFPHCHLHQTIISRSSIFTAILASYLPRLGSPSTIFNSHRSVGRKHLAFPLGSIRVTVAVLLLHSISICNLARLSPFALSTSGLFTSSS
jgi:hypothetical protein